MEHFWNLLIDGNLFLLAVLTWILYQVGCAAAQQSLPSQIWSKRIGFVVFLGFLARSLTGDSTPDETALIVLALRGLLIGWLAGTAALITLPMVFWFNEHIRSQQMSLRESAMARREERLAKRNARETESRRKREQAEWERSAPERERAERLALERAAVERKQKQSSQKRREDVRSQLELLYTFYAPKIQNVFSQTMFDDFESKYMGDERTADEVEERGRQLLAILEQHHNAVVSPRTYSSLEDLANWFIGEQRRLDGLALDEFLKDEFRAILHDRYSELSQKFMQTMQP